MKDYIVVATAANGFVKCTSALTKNLVTKAKEIHNLSPVSSAALGRLMTAAVMMSKNLKSSQNSMTIQINANGPIGSMITVVDYEANVKGYLQNPYVYIEPNSNGKLDVQGAVGKNGYISVIKDLGLKSPYIGKVNLLTGEIAEDIAYYLYTSEQIPCVVSLGVKVNTDESILTAGGFIIELMPGADEKLIDFIEQKIKNLPQVTELLLVGNTPEDILNLILGDKNLKLYEKSSCNYNCDCSRERMERNIISLGKAEILNIVEEQNGAELECHFCNNKYYFSSEELLKLSERSIT